MPDFIRFLYDTSAGLLQEGDKGASLAPSRNYHECGRADLAYATWGVILYGIWRGTRRQAGLVTGKMGGYLRSPWFYLVTTVLFFGVSYLGWVPLPLTIPPQVHTWALLIGSVMYFTGIVLALWGRLALGKNYFVSTGFGAQLFASQQLVIDGPFAIVRHPMYAGLMLAAFGSLLIYHTWTTVLFAGFSPALLFRARREEDALAEEFGEQWREYCQRVPTFIPRFGKGRKEQVDSTRTASPKARETGHTLAA